MSATAEQVEYRDVPGYPGYRVGSDGSVWSRRTRSGKPCDKWRGMSPSYSRNGYASVELWKRGETSRTHRTLLVHRLVLLAFIGEPPDGCECRHIDGNRRNNRIENLAWGTRAENEADKKRHGTQSRLCGSARPNAKLSESDIAIIHHMRNQEGETQHTIAKLLGISQGVVSGILSGRRWGHVVRGENR